jgi:hypothetical protein
MGLSVLAASLRRTLRAERPQHHLTFVDEGLRPHSLATIQDTSTMISNPYRMSRFYYLNRRVPGPQSMQDQPEATSTVRSCVRGRPSGEGLVGNRHIVYAQ